MKQTWSIDTATDEPVLHLRMEYDATEQRLANEIWEALHGLDLGGGTFHPFWLELGKSEHHPAFNDMSGLILTTFHVVRAPEWIEHLILRVLNKVKVVVAGGETNGH